MNVLSVHSFQLAITLKRRNVSLGFPKINETKNGVRVTLFAVQKALMKRGKILNLFQGEVR